MNVKNGELAGMITSLNSLKDLKLDGDISLAVVKLKKALTGFLDDLNQAEKSIIESFCQKDESGTPVSGVKEENGAQFVSYQFDSEETSKKCLIELNNVRSQSVTLPIITSIIENRISLIKCSPEQMEGLLLLI